MRKRDDKLFEATSTDGGSGVPACDEAFKDLAKLRRRNNKHVVFFFLFFRALNIVNSANFSLLRFRPHLKRMKVHAPTFMFRE